MQRRTTIAVAVAAIALAGIAAAVTKPELLSLSSSKDTSPSLAVLATVNKQAITAADVEPLMATGMAKPVAIENAVNKALTAEAARQLWPADAQAIAESVARDALAGLYVRKKIAEIQKAIPDADVARYYDTNITDEMYSGHALKYYLTQDAKDATDTAEAIKQGGNVGAKFNWVNKEGDHSLQPGAVPYGLYQQIKAVPQGQVAGPFRVRDGLLFLRVEERKPGKRPELAKVKDEIKGILAQQRLETELKQLRTQAKIELK